jgi:hypothetical protein
MRRKGHGKRLTGAASRAAMTGKMMLLAVKSTGAADVPRANAVAIATKRAWRIV